MKEDIPHFTIHDTTLCVWPNKPDDRPTFGKIRQGLEKLGFSWEKDPRILRDYPSLAKSHFYGRLKGLEYNAEIHGFLIKVEFYQNFVTVNQYGGRYDFDKLQKMPYIIRLRYRKTVARLAKILSSSGFTDTTNSRHKRAYDAVMAERAELEKTHRGYYQGPRPDYNARDADGVMLKDGDVRWFRDWNGRLAKGTVYHHINNMWWVVANDSRYDNISSGFLFSWKPDLPRKQASDRTIKLERLMLEAANERNYERAIVLRDELERQSKKGKTP